MQEGTIEERDKRARKVFGENLQKLKELKRKYDPNVLFDKWVVVWPNDVSCAPFRASI
ncbi:8001_t:CDS:1 [Ambispora gerdemannii]|uniref:8001_t:CDS:1 n=1 Tax=Ambispora gerdemannii TaxID=144530 RepID=A0A9N9DUB1_9GLOM|nr:8001_t:CDS:1 [Ambispora gerdemannii]